MLIKSKKGQTNIVQSVFILLIVLFSGALIVIGLFAGANAINNSSLFTTTTISGSFTNNTINLTTTPGNSPAAVSGRSAVVLSSVTVVYASNGTTIPAAQFTVSAGNLFADNATVAAHNNNVNVSASFSSTFNSASQNDTESILNNITASGTSFFGNSSTFVSILVVVVIFGFIALLILAARRFGGGGRGTVG